MSVSELNTELEYLSETKSQIKTAITNKGQDITSATPFRDYVEKINNISTLQADTADATATNADIILNKTAYVNGEKVVGTLNDYGSGINVGVESITPNTGYDGSYIEFKAPEQDGPFGFTTNKVEITLTPPMLQVAEGIGLTAEKLVAGNNILGIEGTAITGIDTSDATATSGDLAINKTAYVNGEKITGTLPLFPNTSTFTVSNAGVTDNTEDSTLDLTTINATKQILDSNVSMNFNADYSDVATAIGLTADKIASGNTILGIEGTANVLPENASTYEAGETCGKGGNNQSVKIENGSLVLCANILSPTYLEQGSLITISHKLSGVAMWLNITSDMIVQGNTILGVEGTATTGTTADITIPQDEYGLETATSGEGDNDTGFKFYTNANTQSKLYENGSIVEMHITNELLAQVLGITADKIKKDEVICGITGTYEATVEAQAQIATLTQENQTLNTTIDDSNELAEDILGTATN